MVSAVSKAKAILPGSSPVTRVSVPSIPWAEEIEAIGRELATSETGLSEREVESRLRQFGPNLLVESKRESYWRIWFRQFRSLVVLLLFAAAFVSLMVRDYAEGIAVLVVILLNAVIGFVTEARAARSMHSLRKLAKISVRAVRGGETAVIPADDLVPGDLVLIEAGDGVPADMRISEANLLEADESALTGESLPVAKSSDPASADAMLPDRNCMLFRGSMITAGTGRGFVTATGESSELGKISRMVSQSGRHATPLEKQLDRLCYRLIWVTFALTLLVAATGIGAGHDPIRMLQTAIALAIAAIPEGLPVVATIALAHGVWKMAERKALINRLSAVETLGATSVICTDKTGTLTENRMTVSEIWPEDRETPASAGETLSPDAERALRAGILCNNSDLDAQGNASGDPLERAIVEGAVVRGWDVSGLRRANPRILEIPFDAGTRVMATVHEAGPGKYSVAAKGAPEAILERCTVFPHGLEAGTAESRELWEKRNGEFAAGGLRVIALAGKETQDPDDDPLSGLTFYGLLGLVDPARPDVPKAIADCMKAGVKVVMVTGDQAPTARSIAREIGMSGTSVLTGRDLEKLDPESSDDLRRILETDVFARASPEQKLMLVKLYQDEGTVVAMTGDGINDAPALKQADIGIAMGKRGTDVAREAAAMVLRDDSFPSIVAAIEQGRTIFSNIRKFVAYLISCNISEILVVALATLFFDTLPILPLQILFLNLVTDVFPALALGVTRPHGNMLSAPPRPAGEPVLRTHDWWQAGWRALVLAAATLGAFEYAQRVLFLSPEAAITVSFLTLAISQLVHVFNMADENESYFTSMVIRNRLVWGAVALCFAVLLAACHVQATAVPLDLRAPSIREWTVVFAFSSVPALFEWAHRLAGKAVVGIRTGARRGS